MTGRRSSLAQSYVKQIVMSSSYKVPKRHRPETPEGPNHAKHRETARVLLTNSVGEYFLMYTLWDPGTGVEPRWLTPGGGIDAGETIIDAAVRELAEETGLLVRPADLGEIVHTIRFRADWVDGRYETGIAYFYELCVDDRFALDNSGWTKDEHRDVLEHRWWSVSDLVEHGVHVGPPGLLDYLKTRP